jgi:hypothetical protein
MLTTSKYVQLTQYALLEYEYNSKVINTSDSSFLRIINGYNNSLNYVSYNPNDFVTPKQLTNNVIDNSVQPISDNRFVHFDLDRPIRFFEQQNSMLTFEGVWEDLETEVNVTYDTIKVHLVSGWNFTDSAGFIIRAAYVDSTLNNVIYVANYAYLKESSNIKLNKRPIFLGNRIYDKYIEVCIPSLNDLSNVNNQLGNTFLTSTGNLLTQDFNYSNAKLNILFYNVGNYALENGQTVLKTIVPIDNETNGLIRIDLDPFDSMAQLSAVIQESPTGDYFELFPAYQGEFIEDFLYDRMAKYSEEYTVIHDIELYEQLSSFGDYTEVQTQKFTYFQEEGFDSPFRYRPIIVSDNAITFTIDYTMRLYNKTNESQIVRRASLTYTNAKKYGKKMAHIFIDTSYQPLRIVNKIVNNDNIIESSAAYNYKRYVSNVLSSQGQSVTTYIPIDIKNICINNYTLFVDNISTSNILFDGKKQYLNTITFKELANSDIIYGQGDAVIYLTEFDNFIKFRIYKHDGSSLTPEVYTSFVSNSNIIFYLVFFDSAGNKISIEQYSDKSNINANLSAGEILFKITATNSTKIITSTNNKFCLTFENIIPLQVTGSSAANTKSDFEVVLYTGTVDSATNFYIDSSKDFILKQNALLALAEELDAIIKK